MLSRLRFLFTGRIYGTVRVPWKERCALIRDRDTHAIPADWIDKVWWPENPKDLERKWKEKDEG